MLFRSEVAELDGVFRPDEDELVLEGLKRARPKPHAFTVRPTVNNWFCMDPPDRRQVRSAGTDLTSFRPATASNSGLRFEGFHASQDSASDLPVVHQFLVDRWQLCGSVVSRAQEHKQHGRWIWASASCFVAMRHLRNRVAFHKRSSSTENVRQMLGGLAHQMFESMVEHNLRTMTAG